jgi:hypothetical protein
MPRHRVFKSPDRNFVEGNFKKTKHPHTPSPKRHDYSRRAKTSDDGKQRCTYIHPQTGKRCRNHLALYPEYCELHTMMTQNVYIGKSHIEIAGKGLYAGPYGFKKGDVVGKYSFKWNSVKLDTLLKRCKDMDCWNYVFCDDETNGHTQCWDGLDIRSTLMRNINDAHKSKYRNNCYFDIIEGQVYVIASRNIKPARELYISYGNKFWD